ncbi:hypothetical protein PFISCL1PPCAC_18969, partial [Pristionchus fissidentatus]
SMFELSVDEVEETEHSISTVATVIRRLNNRIETITIKVNPYEISHFSLLEVLCETTNKEVFILTDGTQSAVSPLTSKFDLSFLIRFIKTCTKIVYTSFVCPSLSINDIIELKKVVIDRKISIVIVITR